MQKTFNSYKSIMIGVNLSGRGFQQVDSTELQELRENLQSVNQKWAQACAALDSWERRLHQALMECQVRKTTVTYLKKCLNAMTMRLMERKKRKISREVCFETSSPDGLSKQTHISMHFRKAVEYLISESSLQNASYRMLRVVGWPQEKRIVVDC